MNIFVKAFILGRIMVKKTTIIKVFIILLCICVLFTSCAPVGNEKEEYSQEVHNLEKLCKVWGYVKYTHPVFLTGEKD